MCLPGGASDGSYIVGIVISSSGRSEGSPYFASSHAALYIFDVGTDVHRGAVVRAGRAGIRREFRQSVQRQIDLATRALDAEVANRIHEFRRQIALIHQLEKRKLRIEIRSHHLGPNLLARFQRDAARSPIAHQHLAHRRIHADLHARFPRRCRNRVRHRAHAAAHESP